MKKYLFLVSAIVLLAASCNQQAQKNEPKQTNQSTLTSDNSQNLPQGNKNGWNTYTSPAKYGFSIQYPNDFGFNTDISKIRPLSYIPACDDTTAACAYLTKDKYSGTNFDSAGVSVNILKDLNTQSQCYNFNVSTNEAQKDAGIVKINNTDFHSATGGGAALGHFDSVKVYRSFHNNTCYEIMQRVANTNIDNYPKGTIKEFNQTEVWNRLDQVLGTFKFISDSKQANYSGTHDANYEGYVTRFHYSLNYPKDKYIITKQNNYLILSDKSKNNLLKIGFYSNDAIGASSALEYWNAVKPCPDCKKAENKIEIQNAKDMQSFAKGSEQWIIFSPQTGGNYVVVWQKTPESNLTDIVKSLNVSTELIKPSGQ